MPYRFAYLWIAGLIPFIALAFWPGYFGSLGEASWAFHLHGITATLWVALAIAQSFLIHHRRRDLHRLAGRASLVLVPAFLSGGFAIVSSMVNQTYEFMLMYRHRLAIADLTTTFAFAALCWAGLRARRHVQLHARYLLATILFVIMPIATRLFSGFVPGLAIRGPEELGRFALGFHLSGLIAMVVALRLYLADRPHGRPFLVVLALLAFQSTGFEWIGRSQVWVSWMEAYAALPAWVLIGAGLVLGLAAVMAGWSGAAQRPHPAPPVAGSAVHG